MHTSAGMLDAITLLKETVAHFNREHTDVHCAMVDLFKAYDRINISSLCDKLKATYFLDKLSISLKSWAKPILFALPMKDVSAMNGK